MVKGKTKPGEAFAELADVMMHETSRTAQAVQQGADMIVVGRPIRDADDPKVAAQRIADEIASVKSTAG